MWHVYTSLSRFVGHFWGFSWGLVVKWLHLLQRSFAKREHNIDYKEVVYWLFHVWRTGIGMTAHLKVCESCPLRVGSSNALFRCWHCLEPLQSTWHRHVQWKRYFYWLSVAKHMALVQIYMTVCSQVVWILPIDCAMFTIVPMQGFTPNLKWRLVGSLH